MKDTIQLKNVSKHFRSGVVPAVNQVNINIPKKDFTVLVGPSGSGKSTLLQLIGSLIKPDKGEVFVDNVNLNQLKRKEVADFRHNHIGIVFQQFHLIPTLTALENVLAPFLPRKLDSSLKEKAIQLMDEMGIGEKQGALPNELSGGQQQRVAIARALMNEPDWILADEPTGNLDTNNSQQLFEMLQKIHKDRQCGIFFVTHDMELASKGTNLLEMQDGRILTQEEKGLMV